MKKRFKTFIGKTRRKGSTMFTHLFDFTFPFIYKRHEEKFTSRLMEDVSKYSYIVSPMESLKVIESFIEEQKAGAYMRFGDGDVFLAMGKNDMLQKSERTLSKEMFEAFAIKGPSIIKALAIHSKLYGSEKEMYIGNHLQKDKMANDLLKRVYPFFVGYQIFSPVALHYAATYCPAIANEFLKKLKRHVTLFIGNENTQQEIIEKLFGPVSHVKTPSKNAYDKINEIEKEATNILAKQKDFGVVIISMGCSGRILMKRLLKNNFNVFFFDFGSLLDGICGHETRPWLKENINYNLLLKNI